jgi:4-hydroxy 2-oxovalerate aldolase
VTAIRITDVTLRDGSHAVRHQFTVEQVVAVSTALAQAGVPVVEISHGDGLGGSSLNYGLSKVEERELMRAAAPILAEHGAKLAVLLLPGIGVATDLEEVREIGASVVRIATHCTEADVAIQHMQRARELGFEAAGFLMMAHMLEPTELAEQAKIHESAGAQTVYVTDSAGALVPSTAAARVAALRAALEPETIVGFHAHNNLALAMGNTLAAIEAGARHIDGSTRGLGAGAGNCSTEALVAACDKLEIETGVDVLGIANAAEHVVAPIMLREPIVDRASLMLGWAGVYSSFLLHAERAAAQYEVDLAELLLEVGRRRAVGGQEDLIVQIALELTSRSPALAAS